MSPNYGDNERPDDVVPDWLLGGNRKRRVLQALAEPARKRGWTAAELADSLGCGRTTAHEILRALRPLDLLEDDTEGGVRLSSDGPLAEAVRALLNALQPFGQELVDRSPRRRGRT